MPYADDRDLGLQSLSVFVCCFRWSLWGWKLCRSAHCWGVERKFDIYTHSSVSELRSNHNAFGKIGSETWNLHKLCFKSMEKFSTSSRHTQKRLWIFWHQSNWETFWWKGKCLRQFLMTCGGRLPRDVGFKALADFSLFCGVFLLLQILLSSYLTIHFSWFFIS